MFANFFIALDFPATRLPIRSLISKRLAMAWQTADNARLLQSDSRLDASCNGDLSGPLAIMTCKPRQARKGATVAVSYVPGCGWLGRHPFSLVLLPPVFPLYHYDFYSAARCCAKFRHSGNSIIQPKSQKAGGTITRVFRKK